MLSLLLFFINLSEVFATRLIICAHSIDLWFMTEAGALQLYKLKQVTLMCAAEL